MASGNSLLSWVATANQPPTTNIATPDTRNAIPLLSFDASLDEEARFSDRLPRHYAGNGITVSCEFEMASATSGNVVLGVSVERADAATDLDTDSFASEVTGTFSVPGTSGFPKYVDIALTNGAQMDSWAVGESGRLKVRRVGSSGSDTAAGDLQLKSVEIRET